MLHIFVPHTHLLTMRVWLLGHGWQQALTGTRQSGGLIDAIDQPERVQALSTQRARTTLPGGQIAPEKHITKNRREGGTRDKMQPPQPQVRNQNTLFLTDWGK